MVVSTRSASCFVKLTCAGLFATLAGCETFSLPASGTPRPGTYDQTTPLRYRLSARTYLVHVPRNYRAERAWPLVLVLHGAFSTAGEMEKWSGFSNLADREDFVVAYPNGIGVFGFLQHWNAGHCCGLAAEDKVDDVGFLRYVIDDVSDRLRIDPQRVYVVGHSNGGMLAYHFASAYSPCLAGVGIVAGALGSSQGARKPLRMIGPPQAPVPLIVIHGREDTNVPFEGGSGPRTVADRRYVSVFDSVECWAGYCGCEVTPQVRADPQSGRHIMTWQDARGNAWVTLHVLEHWGHPWPSRLSIEKRRSKEDPLRTFDAAQTIWDFFRARSAAPPPSAGLQD